MAQPGNFHKKYRKNTPRAEILKTPRKYPQGTEKIPKMGIFGILGVFFRYFRGILGVNSGIPRIAGRGKLRVGPSRGSVAGRGVLKSKQVPRKVLQKGGTGDGTQSTFFGHLP